MTSDVVDEEVKEVWERADILCLTIIRGKFSTRPGGQSCTERKAICESESCIGKATSKLWRDL